MAVNAVVTYMPGPKAVLVRSYYKRLGFNWQPSLTVLSSPQPLVVLEHTFNRYVTTIRFVDAWWFWNSNVYTLDFIVQDFWVVDTVTGLQVPGVPALFYTGFDDDGTPGIGIAWAGASGDPVRLDYPPAPPDYWLQLPPSAE